MAQGFTMVDENECLEDVGHEYFMNLLWRSFFQEVEEDEWGNINFKIYDLIYFRFFIMNILILPRKMFWIFSLSLTHLCGVFSSYISDSCKIT